jgi:hypothetical protein
MPNLTSLPRSFRPFGYLQAGKPPGRLSVILVCTLNASHLGNSVLLLALVTIALATETTRPGTWSAGAVVPSIYTKSGAPQIVIGTGSLTTLTLQCIFVLK